MNQKTDKKRMVQVTLLGLLTLALLTLTLNTAGASIGQVGSAFPSGLATGSDPAVNQAENVPSSAASASVVSDWPQVQHDPQRSGYSPEVLGTNFQVVWTHPFQPERVFPQVQAIIYSSKVYVGTESGNLYALNATTGTQAWRYSAGSPILASAAAGDGKVFFGAMNGKVYALNATTGAIVWTYATTTRSRLGFSTAPVFVTSDTDGKMKVMLGGRNGIFYALDAKTGVLLWQRDVGAPILQTAAWNNGRVFFGSMDMYVYGLNSVTGAVAWKSAQVKAAKNFNDQVTAGMAFKDYWPVIQQGKVIERPMGHGSVTNLATYQANPNIYSKTMFVFDEATGTETTIVHSDTPRMHGAMTPPCVTRDGTIVVPIGGWSTVTWGRQSLTTGAIVESFTTRHNNGDENENVSCSNNIIFIMHVSGGPGAGINGAYNLDNGSWTEIDFGQTNSSMANNTQGGGGSPASISNGLVYHIGGHELVVRSTQ